ncbi:MAG: hypothetical protein ABR879_03920 [Methanomassiliicoccales archaeon]|jgi:putative membrane protein
MMNSSGGERPPGRGWSWWRVVGILLMLPIGLIIALMLVYFIGGSKGYFPGEFLIVLIVAFFILFLARVLFWRSRRMYWRERVEQRQPILILRERYARGEITKEKYDEMMEDLTRVH